MKRKTTNLWIVLLLLAVFGCKQPLDPVIESVLETNSILQDKDWILTDYTVTVKNPDIPPPMLININDSMIEAGNYHLGDMMPGDSTFPIYIMEFTADNMILADSSGVFVNLGGEYFVFNGINIRLKPHGVEKLIYDYYYDPENRTMSFTLTEEQASKAIDNATDNLIKDIINERPEKIGEAISNILHNSPRIQNAIKKMIKHGIAGKLPKIFDYNLEHTADTMSVRIRSHALDSINWKHILKDAIKHELDKIHNLNSLALAPLMTAQVASEIGSELAIEPIYNAVLPYMDGLGQQEPSIMADLIATLIVHILGDIFSEENLEKIIEPIWEEFTQLSDDQIDTIAAKLTEITQDHWLNVDTLTGVFLPYTELIDETPISGLDALAQQATDSLEVFVDKLNDHFPGLGLNPDYDNIESEIHAILLAAKPIIGTVGPEKVAQDIAQLLVDDFLTTQNIQNAFVSALDFLQTIDPGTAAATIAQWLVNIEEKIGPELTAWLAEKLSPILDNMNHHLTSYKIAQQVHEFTSSHFNQESLRDMILPVLNHVRKINSEALAKHIARAIIEKKLAKEGVSVEVLAQVIRPELNDDGSGNSIAKKIMQAMADNNMLRSGSSPDLIAKIISLLLYKEAWDNFKIANNFQEATIIIYHE
jgi:hypothetical protein